ncbi:MAG: carboxypeptidase-like regulatory domain-containing protein, partial [Bryobacterales bacterium]|nr:carboxypeptidase-like regulatory domain-containing protein [Bryobacterales bacterium]
MRRYFVVALLFTIVLALFIVQPAAGQASSGGKTAPTTLEGAVLDATQGSIPGASLVLLPAQGQPLAAETDALGAYVFPNLTPGDYRLQVTSTGFQPVELPSLRILSGVNRRNFTLAVFLTKQEVTVEADPVDSVSVDMASNASALVLKEQQLQALSDDPDALANELQALAGPGAGPNSGAQVFVDGFSGGRVPPKSSIREVRINRDPYSAEFDRPGFGRIEILTKPGSDQLRGQAFFNFSDESLNSRNPFAVNRAPYQARNFGGNLGGPITRKASFFLDFERREIDDNAVVNATTLDSLFQPVTLQQAFVTPQRRGTGTARFDYALNDRNTLVG